MTDTRDIKFGSKKATLLAGIFLIFVAILFEVVAIIGFREDGTDGVIATVLLSVFLVAPLIIGGIGSVYGYFFTGKNLRKKVRFYGKETLLSHIEKRTLRTYQSSMVGRKIYFTDNLVVDAKEAIFDYKEISMMYKHIQTSRKYRVISIAFSLVNGTTYYLCDNATDEEIMDIVRLCCQFNNNILFGASKENCETHKNRVEQYKAGFVKIPKATLDTSNPIQPQEVLRKEEMEKAMPTPWEWTPEGRKQEAGKAMLWLGTIMTIFSIILTFGLMLSFNVELDKEIGAVSERQREELLSQGCREYRTVGKYFDRDINYGFGNTKFDIKNLYLYELEGEEEFCLGILDRNDGIPLNSSKCAGIRIFTKEEPTREIVTREKGVYQTLLLDRDNVVAVYGIPSEESEMTKTINVVVSVGMGTMIFMIGAIFLIVGTVQKKKYKRSQEL